VERRGHDVGRQLVFEATHWNELEPREFRRLRRGLLRGDLPVGARTHPSAQLRVASKNDCRFDFLLSLNAAEEPSEKPRTVRARPLESQTAFGPRAGQKTRRLGEEPDETVEPPKRKRHARIKGFDLHAGAPTKAEERDRLERMLRYLLRPPIAESRLRELPDGNILLTQKTKWSDGTTALVFEPLELLERLVAIIPKPQINLIIYHGVLAPNSHWRKRAVAYGRPEIDTGTGTKPGDTAHPQSDASDPSQSSDPSPPQPRYYAWAELMRRTFGYDVMACLECGGRMKLIAMIEDPAVIEKILDHLGLPTESPVAKPARAPPEQLELPEIDESFNW
jgi:hypothetical protein